jgi:hypothetical protein
VAGALTGLLFVALSVKGTALSASRSAVLVGVAGITFLLRAGGGLYWLIPAAVASLLGGVINTWLFLVRAN